ncbi:PREDICTED: adenylate kinase isoenzyme 5 isoform X2 [Papilio polytes]|uniref:adenylate kinase isoenzyme 5 isoform X2 n=1 Tax=Papilio polytes TaxID=76194 RepID=UPI000675E658|nr:PREDICTED: adenylate kinase isoenzyme 5 isoform X2 [Papilio polytes]
MGICLDTEQNNEEQDRESYGESRRGRESAWGGATPPAAAFPMQNSSHVKFEPPTVPVIFVLGPGSGKVTHCDTLVQERRGLVHVNMTDLLQQYAIGNDMQDFGSLSSRTVTEVLMLEMKMAPAAGAYLVSGYPRSMRDLAEYTDKIQTVSGAVVVSWRQRVLERQIEYGARLGHVVLSLARMELAHFYRHVVPVADYFDHTGMLIVVNGERNPEEVYKDFRAAVLQILGTTEDENINGVSGVGANGIPGEIVGVEPAPVGIRGRSIRSHGPDGRGQIPDGGRQEPVVVDEPLPAAVPVVLPVNGNVERIVSPKAEVIRVRGAATRACVVCVVGGPGSNKAALCQRAVAQAHGWTHYSLGQRLRSLAESGGGAASDGALSRAALAGGELVSNELVGRLVRAALGDAARTGHGLVLDGYPRDLQQLDMFEKELKLSPRMVLVDCSKLQLGRGRRDDSVAAFRRRLEVFRELSLPMLKTLDHQHRLTIVDGDTDSAEVQEEFTRVLLEEMEKAEALAAIPQDNHITQPEETALPQGLPRANGVANGVARAHNGVFHNGALANGFAAIANNKVKPIINNINRIPTISQMTHDDVKRLYQQNTGDVSLTHHI